MIGASVSAELRSLGASMLCEHASPTSAYLGQLALSFGSGVTVAPLSAVVFYDTAGSPRLTVTFTSTSVYASSAVFTGSNPSLSDFTAASYVVVQSSGSAAFTGAFSRAVSAGMISVTLSVVVSSTLTDRLASSYSLSGLNAALLGKISATTHLGTYFASAVIVGGATYALSRLVSGSTLSLSLSFTQASSTTFTGAYLLSQAGFTLASMTFKRSVIVEAGETCWLWTTVVFSP